MLEACKMCKWKDLCRSEKDQIVMVRQVGQTISNKGKNSKGTSIRAFRSKKFMLVLIKRCQNTESIAVCCTWGCIAADQT